VFFHQKVKPLRIDRTAFLRLKVLRALKRRLG
jgi:hypothetical protein